MKTESGDIVDSRKISAEDIAFFTKEFEERLSHFDSILQLPDDVFNKLNKLYDRFCAIDKLNEKISGFTDNYEKYKKAVEMAGGEEKLKELVKNVAEFSNMIYRLDI